LTASNPTPAAPSASGIALAKRQFPQLCTDGLYPYPGTAPRLIDPAQVETAIAFLSMLSHELVAAP
jgi:hypothetical protein